MICAALLPWPFSSHFSSTPTETDVATKSTCSIISQFKGVERLLILDGKRISPPWDSFPRVPRLLATVDIISGYLWACLLSFRGLLSLSNGPPQPRVGNPQTPHPRIQFVGTFLEIPTSPSPPVPLQSSSLGCIMPAPRLYPVSSPLSQN